MHRERDIHPGCGGRCSQHHGGRDRNAYGHQQRDEQPQHGGPVRHGGEIAYHALLSLDPAAHARCQRQVLLGVGSRPHAVDRRERERDLVLDGRVLFTSAEYLAFNRDNNGFVTDLYNTFFNRPPDIGGLDYWTGQLDSGMPREVVLVSLMFTTEFVNSMQAIFGNTAARTEVDTLMDFYRGLLARLPDNSGFNFWVARFRNAQCAGTGAVTAQAESISSQFALGSEYSTRTRNNSQYVGDLYNAFLRRGGDSAGVQFWINQITSGALTREQVRQQFVASPEFSARVAAVIAQGCLTAPVAPTATTSAASTITSTGATLNGSVNDMGAATTVTFEYGTTTGYGTSVAASPSTVAGGARDVSVAATVAGLAPSTTYHFRVRGTNSAGTTLGANQSFTTPAAAPWHRPPPPAQRAPSPRPAPPSTAA
ncbi:MAG: DUF4214 domain-containing protein [Betaproteobacteria bacterium]|nr:DUF4214 domain-containing protein [Betaproteobacteria bacterium]